MTTRDQGFSEKWLAEYLGTVPVQPASREKERIEITCAQLRLLRPGEPFVAYCRSTEWIPSWADHVSKLLPPAERLSRIQALGRWWAWLFDRGRIEDNVLACFDPYSDALRNPPLTLHHNLQRQISGYLQERGTRRASTRRKVRRTLLNFNVFAHRLRFDADAFSVDDELIQAWLRDLARTNQLSSLVLIASTTDRFLEYLVDSGHLSANPFRTLRARYDVQSRAELVAGLVGPDGQLGLRPAQPAPRFRSLLGPHLEAFIALKRAMGRRYETRARELERFDRFVATFEPSTDVVTQELVDAWLTASSRVHPRTRSPDARIGTATFRAASPEDDSISSQRSRITRCSGVSEHSSSGPAARPEPGCRYDPWHSRCGTFPRPSEPAHVNVSRDCEPAPTPL